MWLRREVFKRGKKGKGREYSKYPLPGKGLGDSQLNKRVYCYSKWMWMSRKFLGRGNFFLGLVHPTVLGVMAGSGGMGLSRRFSMVLLEPCFFVAIGVRIVD